MIRKAVLRDAQAIHDLINLYARKELLLPRSLASIYEHIRDFWIYEEEGKIIACCALQVLWEDLAEVRSLAVLPERRGEGIGRRLVSACLEEARQLGVKRVFSLTYEREFFESLGFREIKKETLPQKVWTDCVNCPKLPTCDEIAVIREIGGNGERTLEELQRLHEGKG